MSQVTLTFTFPDQQAAKDFMIRAVPATYTEADAKAHVEGAAKTEVKAPAAPAPKPPAPAPAKPPAPKPAAVEYSVLQKAVFELAGKSRDKATELLAQFEVKSFKDLAAERYAEALAAVKAAIAELDTAVA
jgi:hypothetical protein